MPTTHDLLHRIRVLVASLEASEGEADSDTEDALLALATATDNKTEALLAVLSRLDLEAEDCLLIERRAKARRERIERADQRVRGLLRELVQGHEALTGESKIRTAYGTAYLTHSTRVEGPEDPSAWPAQYREETVRVTADRKRALADLRAGAQVPGLALVDSVSVGVRR